MLRSVAATNYVGNTITMTLDKPRESGFLITNIDGLGPVSSSIHTTELSTMDGSIYSGARSPERNIVLDLVMYGSDVETLRHRSYEFFPIKQPVTLTIVTDERVGKITGYVEKNEPTIFTNMETTQVSIICPEPWFKSETDQRIEFSSAEPWFEFPFSNESLTEPMLEISKLIHNQSESFNYQGDIRTGFEIKIDVHGTDIGDITIANSVTNERMVIRDDSIATITGSKLISGDTIYVNTRDGHKGIQLLREGKRTNILNSVDRESDWFSLQRGLNTITYTAEGETKLYFTLTIPVLYEGM